MGYLFLLIALLCGATKGFCGKKTSGYVEGFADAMLANTVRMVFCIAIGAVMMLLAGDTSYFVPERRLLLLSALSGISTSVFVVSWLVAVKKGAYMMLDVFLMLGVLVPTLASYALFGEPIRINQWIGMAVVFVAVLIMCSYNNSIKEKITPASMLLLVVCGLSNGITDFSQKCFVKTAPEVPVSAFNFYTYIFSAITLLICYIVLNHRASQKEEKKESPLKHIIGYVLLMSLCLFLNSYFKTLAAAHLDSAQLYPLNQGAALILSSVMAAVFFKEKLTMKAIIGLVIAFVGLLIINVL